ncbi:hypothetical protein J3459_006415 [Metarhizium acridum]|nr:hypothetical protein J3459_006415 [Metarhizium acridum]
MLPCRHAAMPPCATLSTDENLGALPPNWPTCLALIGLRCGQSRQTASSLDEYTKMHTCHQTIDHAPVPGGGLSQAPSGMVPSGLPRICAFYCIFLPSSISKVGHEDAGGRISAIIKPQPVVVDHFICWYGGSNFTHELGLASTAPRCEAREYKAV